MISSLYHIFSGEGKLEGSRGETRKISSGVVIPAEDKSGAVHTGYRIGHRFTGGGTRAWAGHCRLPDTLGAPSQPVSGVLCPACGGQAAAISLGRRLPDASSGCTRRLSGRTSLPPYSALLPMGFALPATLLPPRCALTAPFHPCPHPASAEPLAVCFLWHFP